MDEANEKEYVVGEPIPISELKIVRAPHYPWWSILKAIPEGTAQEVKMSYTSCKRAIDDFVKGGKLRKGEFGVASKKTEKDKRKVFILHYGIKRK